jgi:hypothetical protein
VAVTWNRFEFRQAVVDDGVQTVGVPPPLPPIEIGVGITHELLYVIESCEEPLRDEPEATIAPT